MKSGDFDRGNGPEDSRAPRQAPDTRRVEHGIRPDTAARLDAALGGLPRDVAPSRDLWTSIETQLEPRGETRLGPRAGRVWRSWAGAAAAAVVLVVASSWITASVVRREGPVAAAPAPKAAPAATEEAAPDAPTVSAALFGPGQVLDPAYDRAREQLVRELSARIDRLPPAARLKLESDLAELRRASAAINEALELRPGDPLLEELLLNTYQDELAVLASVNQLAGPNGNGATNDESKQRLQL